MDGANLKQLTNLKIEYLWMTSYPRWSPDGTKIIFEYVTNEHSKDSPAISIFTINPDGSDMNDLIGDGATYHGLRQDPAWSPDSKKVAFVTYENSKDSTNIYIMDANGTNIARITDSPYAKRQPVFSPDGTQICYVGYPNGISNGGQLFIVDLKTRKEYRVTKPGRVKAWPGKVDDRDPDWIQ
jgi:TolB protein